VTPAEDSPTIGVDEDLLDAVPF